MGTLMMGVHPETFSFAMIGSRNVALMIFIVQEWGAKSIIHDKLMESARLYG